MSFCHGAFFYLDNHEFSKKSKTSKSYTQQDIKAITKKFQKELPGKLAALNAIKPYRAETLKIDPQKVTYLESNEQTINTEVEHALALMKELSQIGLIDVADESLPYTDISNLDFYYQSWSIMKFKNFNGKTPLGTHFLAMGQVFGKGMIERYPNLKWHYSAHHANDGNLILLDLQNDIELNPLESLMRCKQRNEQNPFDAIEKKYIEVLNSFEDYERITII